MTRPPWSILAFAALFLTAATGNLAFGLADLAAKQAEYALAFDWMEWDRDATIVMLSALYTIAFIPVALIVWRRTRIARWLVALGTLYALIGLPQLVGRDWMAWLEPILLTSAMICLFLPASNRWFAGEEHA